MERNKDVIIDMLKMLRDYDGPEMTIDLNSIAVRYKMKTLAEATYHYQLAVSAGFIISKGQVGENQHDFDRQSSSLGWAGYEYLESLEPGGI